MARKQKEFIPLSEDEKLNPDTLREVLFLIRGAVAGRSVTEFARIAKPYARFNKCLNTRAINNIEAGETYIEYWHIEVYAKVVGMSAGALLLFSRIKSDLKKNGKDSSKTLEIMRHILNGHEEFIDEEMGIETIRKWQGVFNEKWPEQYSEHELPSSSNN